MASQKEKRENIISVGDFAHQPVFWTYTPMFPTVARLSKASRAPLTPKRGNKDFYKGNFGRKLRCSAQLTLVQAHARLTSPVDDEQARRDDMSSAEVPNTSC